MRAEFAAALVGLAERDERVVLLTGDLGFTVLEGFAERHPERFYNVGVAEQNMVGVATGLADAGFVPFAYSIATFASMRAYEFVRNGPALHELPVRVVGVGGGFDYGHNGVTHYALEDVALMRIQPELTVITPADPEQAVAALEATTEVEGPVYFRLGRQATPVPGLGGRFRLGGLETVGDGTDVVIAAMGAAAHEAVEAADLLREDGLSVTVAVCACMAPAPTEELVALLDGARTVITVEGHYVTGGLGSLVAETIAEHGLHARLVRAGVRTMPRGATGSQAHLHERHGLDPAGIAAAARQALSLTR